ncbi:Zinc finger protein 500 [Colletotrichum trifolii]|uniref:Zinc finger protein 500 n=1 Tax=Colletotrichum trifolii TaxID=5466 RepID=A0A4R8QTW1_COLTR|nr:Zinc finger protein 500 [Colletotrichum trifolii]
MEGSGDSLDATAAGFGNEDASQAPFVCPEPDCDKGYDKMHRLTKHMKKHSKPHKCEADPERCDESFADRKGWERHIRASHKSQMEANNVRDENCKCPDCGKKFTRKDNFTRHRKNRCNPR